MQIFELDQMPPRERHTLLLSGVAPRPIALVATCSERGEINLSPYSFFNAVSSNPPIVVFSPSFRGTDGTAKDTFLNLIATGECTISAVTYSMVEQINLASASYPHGVDEFVKAGLTPHPSVGVRPPGVAESPFIMECKLLQHITLAEGKPAAGNIMICKVERIHVADSAFEGDAINPARLDLVARLGRNWYSRADAHSLFELPAPRWNGIGFDALPAYIRHSEVLTGNDLAKLAGVERMPQAVADINTLIHCPEPVSSVNMELQAGTPERAFAAFVQLPKAQKTTRLLHSIAQAFLAQQKIEQAWQLLLHQDSLL